MKNGKDETLIEFPCDFTLKIFVKSESNFEGELIKLIQSHFKGFTADSLIKRPSKNDKYLAYSATVHAQNKMELDALYMSLSEHPDVVMTL